MTSQVSLLSSGILASLRRIDGTSPFANAVKLVTDDVRMIGSINAFPSIIALVTGWNMFGDSTEEIFEDASILVLVYVEVTNRDSVTATQQLYDIAADVTYAMISNDPNAATALAWYQHGGGAYTTKPVGGDVIGHENTNVLGVSLKFTSEIMHPRTVAV